MDVVTGTPLRCLGHITSCEHAFSSIGSLRLPLFEIKPCSFSSSLVPVLYDSQVRVRSLCY